MRPQIIVIQILLLLNIGIQAQNESRSDDEKLMRNIETFFETRVNILSEQNEVLYLPRLRPLSVRNNGIYCYFSMIDGKAQDLHLVINRNTTFKWEVYDGYLFNIDGTKYKLIPESGGMNDEGRINRTQSDDIKVSQREWEIINGIVAGKKIKVYYIGKEYTKNAGGLSKSQLEVIRKTVEYYRHFGGTV